MFVLIINSVKKVVLYRGKNAIGRFIGAILEEYYCQKIISHFNKNLAISAAEEERYGLKNICWICNELFDAGDNKV